MLVSIIFSVPSALAYLFYVLWQTYVYVVFIRTPIACGMRC
jgi:hypothetical protein